MTASTEQERYLAQILDAIRKERKYQHEQPIVMLSGGVDSYLLAAAARKLYGVSGFTVLTIVGQCDTEDTRRASRSATELGCTQDVVTVTLEDMLARLHRARNLNIKSVFSLMFFLLTDAALDSYVLSGGRICARDILHGDGADSLYGSTSSHTYMKTNEYASEHNLSPNDARTALKRNRYNRKKQSPYLADCHLFSRCVELRGGHAIYPYLDPSVQWVIDLPYSVMRPVTKGWVRDALRLVWGMEAKTQRRFNMQQGTGLYERFCEAIIARTGARSKVDAVRRIIHPIDSEGGLFEQLE